MNRNQVFEKLKELGATKAIVAFSGGNDEGGVDDIYLYNNDQQISHQFGSWYTGHTWGYREDGSYGVLPDKEEADALAVALVAPVDERYATFAGEFYVHGEVVWDVEQKTVYMKGQESYETWSAFEDHL